VRAAAVTASDASGAGPRLLAAVVLEPGSVPFDAQQTRTQLRERLPAYMIPSTIAALDAFPLTQTGKVDRPALAEQLHDYREPADDDGPPATDTERALAAIWARVLGRTEIGRGQNFFDLGGHSLLAAQTVVAVEEELGRSLPLAAFFRTDATVAALAALIDGADASGMPTAANRTSELVVELRAGDSPVLFAIHPDEASLLVWRRWLPWFDSSRAVYGLLPPKIGRQFDRTSSVEQLSEALLEPLLAVQPHGPFSLEGYSFGGLLAYELARLLRDRGHEVAVLALVDTPLPTLWVRQAKAWAKVRWEIQRGPRSAARKVTGMVARHSRSALSRLGVANPGDPGWFDSDGSTALGARYRPQPTTRRSWCSRRRSRSSATAVPPWAGNQCTTARWRRCCSRATTSRSCAVRRSASSRARCRTASSAGAGPARKAP